MAEVVLYDYWRSSASYRLRIALGLLGIAYRTVPVDLLAGGHKSPAYLQHNPQGLVPALEIDGIMMTQSVAILEYLDETRPGLGLLPTDTLARQRVRALSHVRWIFIPFVTLAWCAMSWIWQPPMARMPMRCDQNGWRNISDRAWPGLRPCWQIIRNIPRAIFAMGTGPEWLISA